MKFRFFTIPVMNPIQMGEELNTFIAGHRIISVEKKFVDNGDSSFWTFCLTYLESDGGYSGTKPAKIDYKTVLNEGEFSLFVRLRQLRKELAEKEGIPAYAIFTNDQLADMIRNRAATEADLLNIGGVGKSRVEKYGKEFLSLVNQVPDSPAKDTVKNEPDGD